MTHPDVQGNPPLMYMIGDMAEMSGDPRLQQYVQSYLAEPASEGPRTTGHVVLGALGRSVRAIACADG